MNGNSGIRNTAKEGIYLYNSNNNQILNNYVHLNPDCSIHLEDCDGGIGSNIISGNEVTTNHQPSIGIYLESSDNHIVEFNWVYSMYVFKCILLDDAQGNNVRWNSCNNIMPYHISSYGIYLTISGGTSPNQIFGNTCTGNWEGIYLEGSSNNNIYDNIIQQNHRGISLVTISNNNEIYDNEILENTKYGAKIMGCSNNNIYNNNFINNNGATTTYNPANVQAYDNGGLGVNSWDAGSTIGGNYWCDWTTPDNNGDGYVDFPYILDGVLPPPPPPPAQDNWPSTTPWP
jgi:parallel beta-helix repeat protein